MGVLCGTGHGTAETCTLSAAAAGVLVEGS